MGDGSLSVQATIPAPEVNVTAGEATLTGNVTLTKGDLKVSCPRIDLKFDATPHVTWAKGSGGVTAEVHGVHFPRHPRRRSISPERVVDLRGGVRLARGAGWIRRTRRASTSPPGRSPPAR